MQKARIEQLLQVGYARIIIVVLQARCLQCRHLAQVTIKMSALIIIDELMRLTTKHSLFRDSNYRNY